MSRVSNLTVALAKADRSFYRACLRLDTVIVGIR